MYAERKHIDDVLFWVLYRRMHTEHVWIWTVFAEENTHKIRVNVSDSSACVFHVKSVYTMHAFCCVHIVVV